MSALAATTLTKPSSGKFHCGARRRLPADLRKLPRVLTHVAGAALAYALETGALAPEAWAPAMSALAATYSEPAVAPRHKEARQTATNPKMRLGGGPSNLGVR